MDLKHEVVVGGIYDSNNCGKFQVIDEISITDPRNIDKYQNRRTQYLIRFLDTGYETIVVRQDIVKGVIKDYFKPSIENVGYLGDKFENLGVDSTSKQYRMWARMLSRCYNPKNNEYKNCGALGISVDPAWHCFKTFLIDIQYLPGYNDMMMNPTEYVLSLNDSQINLPDNQKVYSKYTCVFISKAYSMQLKGQKYKSSTNYYGVNVHSANTFKSRVSINGKDISIGCFKDPVAAAAMHDYYAIVYNKYPLLNFNGNPPMSFHECVNARGRKPGNEPIIMCEYVDKENEKKEDGEQKNE